MNIRILTIALLYFICMAAKAEDISSTLVVWKSDGTKISYSLDEKPQTHFSVEGITISTPSISVTYPVGTILKYTFESSIDGITPIVFENNIKQDGNKFVISKLDKDTPISVYLPSGLCVFSILAQKNQTQTVSLDGQPKGVYIVKIGERIHKFIKK